VRDDAVHGLGDDDRALGLGVDVGEQAVELVGGQEQRVALVVGPVDRHADAVEERCGRDHDLRVALGHPVVGDHRRHDAPAEQQPRDAQGDVRDDLDVHPRVIGERQARRVDAGDVPPRLHLRVGVDRLEELLEAAVAARRGADANGGDRLGRRRRTGFGVHRGQTTQAAGDSSRRRSRTRDPGVGGEELVPVAAQRHRGHVAVGERRAGVQLVSPRETSVDLIPLYGLESTLDPSHDPRARCREGE
jgi:hypothetical protein